MPSYKCGDNVTMYTLYIDVYIIFIFGYTIIYDAHLVIHRIVFYNYIIYTILLYIVGRYYRKSVGIPLYSFRRHSSSPA